MIIAHRANIYGPNPHTENSIESLKECVDKHINVELDIWYKNGKYYLGHDEPKTEFEPESFRFGLITVFYHCKTIETFFNLRKIYLFSKQFDLFMHDKDAATLTNNGIIWTYPGQPLYKHSIAVMPEIVSPSYLEQAKSLYSQNKITGVCTDYVQEWRAK
jgi:hypothetical protein